MMGVKLDIEDAYRFARGEQVTATHGLPARLGRPLDFLVITDHSDAMGVMDQLAMGNPELLKHKKLRDMHEALKSVYFTSQRQSNDQAPRTVSFG